MRLPGKPRCLLVRSSIPCSRVRVGAGGAGVHGEAVLGRPRSVPRDANPHTGTTSDPLHCAWPGQVSCKVEVAGGALLTS